MRRVSYGAVTSTEPGMAHHVYPLWSQGSSPYELLSQFDFLRARFWRQFMMAEQSRAKSFASFHRHGDDTLLPNDSEITPMGDQSQAASSALSVISLAMY